MSPPSDDSNKQGNAILQQMEHFNVEYVERELQKQSALQVAIVVQDKRISALTSRKCDRAREKLFRMKKDKAADELNNVVENLDREIKNLVMELRTLQETEIQHDRDKKVIMMTCQVMVKENIHHCLEGHEVIENDVLIKKSTPDKSTPDRNTPGLYSRYGDYPVYVVLHQDLP
ncbi:hypothetical protein MHU86_21019 [Fragilaria crotonensis]|nr:hypothetical protein MHU86_21019 [Fragilaria crotonensis]